MSAIKATTPFRVFGRVKAVRKHGKLAFLDLLDLGRQSAPIQAMVSARNFLKKPTSNPTKSSIELGNSDGQSMPNSLSDQAVAILQDNTITPSTDSQCIDTLSNVNFSDTGLNSSESHVNSLDSSPIPSDSNPTSLDSSLNDSATSTEEAFAEALKMCSVGNILEVRGQLSLSNTGQPTLFVRYIKPLASCHLDNLPFKTGLLRPELRHGLRHMDCIVNDGILQTFRHRSLIIAAIRDKLHAMGYVEVETPCLWPSIGGASAKPFVMATEARSLSSLSIQKCDDADENDENDPKLTVFSSALSSTDSPYSLDTEPSHSTDSTSTDSLTNSTDSHTNSPHSSPYEYDPIASFQRQSLLPLSLRISPELFLKRMVVAGMPKVFEIGKQFRNESIDDTHHPEFSSLEMYTAFSRLDDMYTFVESLLAELSALVRSSRAADSAMQKQYLKQADPSNNSVSSSVSSIADQLTSSTAKPEWTESNSLSADRRFPRIDVCDALERIFNCPVPSISAQMMHDYIIQQGMASRLPKTSLKEGTPSIASREDLLDKCIELFVEGKLNPNVPTFLINHPIELSPLAEVHSTGQAMSQNEQSYKAKRFELFWKGMELANAYVELADPGEQERRLLKQANGNRALLDEEFLHALRTGMPPTVGLGIGLDRLCMALLGKKNIKDVILFPMTG